MNAKSTGSYLLHKSNSLTSIAIAENVQPKVFTFAKKENPQIDSNFQSDFWIINNESPLTHPSVNSAEAIGIREDSQQCKPP